MTSAHPTKGLPNVVCMAPTVFQQTLQTSVAIATNSQTCPLLISLLGVKYEGHFLFFKRAGLTVHCLLVYSATVSN